MNHTQLPHSTARLPTSGALTYADLLPPILRDLFCGRAKLTRQLAGLIDSFPNSEHFGESALFYSVEIHFILGMMSPFLTVHSFVPFLMVS
jgi:hypothetical protein